MQNRLNWMMSSVLGMVLVGILMFAQPAFAEKAKGLTPEEITKISEEALETLNGFKWDIEVTSMTPKIEDRKTTKDVVIFKDNKLSSEGLAAQGYHKPLFITTFDCGTWALSDHPVLRAQWELAWNPADHDLLFTSPGYMFAQDRNGRPTATAMAAMAAMDAAAITAAYEDRPWFCPTFLLAEMDGDTRLRVKARSMTPLVIDAADPFDAGTTAGFRLVGAGTGVKVVSVALADDDPQDLILTLSAPPKAKAVTLCYGFGAAARKVRPGQTDAHPAAAGSVRDESGIAGPDGRPLHRWALPCALPVH